MADEEPLFLEIDIIGDLKAMQQMQAVAKSVKSIQAPMTSAADKTQRMSRNLSSAVGPAQRLAKAITQLRVAQGGGGSNASVFDAQFRAQQAQKSFSRAQSAMNPTGTASFGSKLLNVLKSSRVGIGGGAGGGLMPLVGQVMGLLGPEATLAAAGIAAMAETARAAAESLTNFKDAMITSGGSAGEVGKLNVYGGAAGVSDMAGLSRSLADKLSTGGQAAAFGQNAGIHDYGGGFSDIDKAKNLQKAIDYMLSPRTSEIEAQRFARVEGLESLLKLRGISEQTKRNMDAAGRLSASAHGADAVKQAAEFNAAIAIAGTNFDTLTTTLGSSFLPAFTGAIALFNDFAKPLNDATIALKPLIDLLMMATPEGMLAALHKAIDAFHKVAGDNSDETDSRDRHTDAMREHARALHDQTAGGGERARNALPSAWGGSNANNWTPATAKMGAFEL